MYKSLISLTISNITQDTLDMVDIMAKAENRTRSGQIRHVLDQWAKTATPRPRPQPKMIILSDTPKN